MASYLFPYQQQTIEPYKSPLQTYAQALQIKSDRLNRSLSNIRSKYDSILNTPLTNEEDQMALRNGVASAMDSLSKVSINDISLPENQAQINSTFDSILNDQDLMYDAAWTRGHSRELKKAEDLQKKSPELVVPQNLDPLYKAQEAFRQAPKGSRPRPSSFTPFYDFDGKVNGNLDKIKADVDRIFSVTTNKVIGPDGREYSVSTPSQYTVKQLKDYKINQLVWESVNSDSQALNQMSLNYNYNKSNGLYPPEAALSGLNSELSTYQALSEGLTQSINSNINLESRALSASEKDVYKGRLKSVNGEIQRLQQLKEQIKVDPSKSNEWFTFNKYIKDYVSGKVSQYSYKEDSLISSVPGLDEMAKATLDIWKDQWKTKFEADKAAATTKAGKVDETTFVRSPYNDILTQLSSSPAGINATAPQIQALGQMNIDKDGRLFQNWTGKNSNPDNTLIIKPAQGSLDNGQITTIDGNIILNRMESDLENLKLPTPNYTPGVPGSFGSQPSTGNTKPYKSGQDVLNDYYTNPNGVDSKVKAVIERYKPILSSYGIDPSSRDQKEKLRVEMKRPEIQQAVDFGTTVAMNGRFEFVPDQGSNLVRGDNGKMYMKGSYIMPQNKAIEAMGAKGLHAAIDNGIATSYGIVSAGGDADEKYKKMNEQTYALSVYVPVNGDVAQINDKLLDTENFQQQWGKDAPQMREVSRQRTLQMQDIVNRSRGLSSFNLPFAKNPDGTYRVDFSAGSTPSQVKSYNDMVTMATEISTRTGVDYSTVSNQLKTIFATVPDPLGRQMAIDNYINTPVNPSPNGSPSGFRRFNSYVEGRQALENQLNLYKTGATKNNVGPNSTILEAMSVYAPVSDNNNPTAYANRVAQALGVSVSTPISQIDVKKWADVIEIVEGNNRGDNNPGNLR